MLIETTEADAKTRAPNVRLRKAAEKFRHQAGL